MPLPTNIKKRLSCLALICHYVIECVFLVHVSGCIYLDIYQYNKSKCWLIRASDEWIRSILFKRNDKHVVLISKKPYHISIIYFKNICIYIYICKYIYIHAYNIYVTRIWYITSMWHTHDRFNTHIYITYKYIYMHIQNTHTHIYIAYLPMHNTHI